MKVMLHTLRDSYYHTSNNAYESTGELGYDGLNGTRKIGPSYSKSVVYI